MITTDMLLENLSESYLELINATTEYREFSEKRVRQQNMIDVESAKLIDSGEINGKNAETRQAQLRLNLIEEFEELDVLTQLESKQSLRKEIAQLKVSLYRDLLRVAELSRAEE